MRDVSAGRRLIGDGSASTATRSGFVRTTGWSMVAEAGGQATLLLFGAILAAVIGPAGYGIVAMATVYVMLVELVQRQGIVGALIQRRRLTDDHASSAFWLVLLTSAVLTVLSVAFADEWAAANGVPLLGPVIVALSALLPLKALIVVQEALLRRALDFKRVALRTSAGPAVGGAVGVVVAFVEPSVWALVIQQVTGATFSVILLWSATRWRPRIVVNASSLRDLWGFSAGSFLSSLAVFVSNRADMLLIGLLFGPVPVGLYAFCVRLIDALIGLSVRPMQSLALPELSPLQERRDEFRNRLRRLNTMMAVLGLPALGMMAACAEPFMRLLGPEWFPAVLPLQLLCVAAVVLVMTGTSGPSLQAIGRPHLQAAVTWVAAILSAATFLAAAWWLAGESLAVQVSGLALARVMWSVLVVFLGHLAVMWAVLGLTPAAALRPFLPSLVAGVTAALAGLAIGRMDPIQNLPALGHLLLVTAVAGTVALALLGVVEPPLRTAARRLPTLVARATSAGGHRAETRTSCDHTELSSESRGS